MKKETKIILFIAIFYLLYLTAFLAKFDFNPSATIELSEGYKEFYYGNIPDNIVIYENGGGFDGQFYYLMALNPNLDHINTSPVFLQRIFFPFITIIVSLGIKELFPFAMLLINFSAIILSSVFIILILKKNNVNTNLTIFFAINVGFLVTILRDLTEPLMTLLITASIYYLYEKKYIVSSIFLTFAFLTKELVLLVYVAILLFFLIQKKFKPFFIYFLSIIPFVIWETILFIKFNLIPLALEFSAISKPLIGFINYFKEIPMNINYQISQPIINNQLFVHSTLSDIKNTFNILPLLLLILIQLTIVIIILFKTKKITLHSLLLLSQIALFFSLENNFFFYHRIDGIGRYAIILILFAIIFYAKEKKNFNRLLNILSIISLILLILNSISWVIDRIVFFTWPFYIT